MSRRSSFDGHGPEYDLNTATLKRFRSKARKGLRALPFEDRRAYGAAVETAVLAAQRSQLNGASPPQSRPRCASGTWHTTGEEIDAAIRAQHRASLLAAPGKERRARKPGQWVKLYEQAMAEKRRRMGAMG